MVKWVGNQYYWPSFYNWRYIYIYIYILKSVYFGGKLLLRQVFLKTMETLLIILIFQVFLLVFLCRDPDGKGIVPYLLPKRFRLKPQLKLHDHLWWLKVWSKTLGQKIWENFLTSWIPTQEKQQVDLKNYN